MLTTSGFLAAVLSPAFAAPPGEAFQRVGDQAVDGLRRNFVNLLLDRLVDDWEGDRTPQRSPGQTIIDALHPRGFTAHSPSSLAPSGRAPAPNGRAPAPGGSNASPVASD